MGEMTVRFTIRRRRCPPHADPVIQCITCGRPPSKHRTSCLCQDFRTVCSRCRMQVW